MATSERATTQESISAITPVDAPARETPRRARDEDFDLFFNRETSWMRFNERVLELAEDESVPLLERVKFCAIYTTNLDEFFMIRVAGLHDLVDAGIADPLADGRSPSETMHRIREKAGEHHERLARSGGAGGGAPPARPPAAGGGGGGRGGGGGARAPRRRLPRRGRARHRA